MSVKQSLDEILLRGLSAPSGNPNAKDFHLTSTIGEVRVSTVRLPFRHINGEYETCLFQRHPTGVGDSDVVERYETEEQARSGHDAWTRRVEEHGFEARHLDP